MEGSKKGKKEEKQLAKWAQDFDASLRKVKASDTVIEDRLEKLPGLIELKESEIYEASCEISNIKQAKELEAARIMQEITKETLPVEEGKAPKFKFGNEAARNAELLRRENFDDDFKDVKAREEALHRKYEAIKRRLHLYENMFSAAKWLVKQGSSRGSESNEP